MTTNLIKFVTGTSGKYKDLASKDDNTLYFVTEGEGDSTSGVIYKGTVPYGLSSTVSSAISQNTTEISNLKSTVGGTSEGKDGTITKTGLVKEVADNKTAIETNKNAIATTKTALEDKITDSIEALDIEVNSTGGKSVRVHVVEEDGKITGVTVDDSAIASTYQTQAAFNEAIGTQDATATIGGSVYAYINQKTSGIATDANLTALTKRVGTAEGDITAAKGNISSLQTAVNTLNGESDGSVKKTVADKIAEVVAGAPEDFDTLKEIADWIANDKTSAAAMQSSISTNKNSIDANATKITTLEGLVGTNSVSDQIDAKIGKLDKSVAQEADATNGLTATVTQENGLVTGITVSSTKTFATTTDVSDAKTALEGASNDTSSSSTIAGAKKYAEAQASTAANNVKEDLVGIDSDTGDSNTITGAKKFATTAANSAKSELIGNADSDDSTSNTIAGAKKFATAAAGKAKEDLVGTSSDDASAGTIAGAKKYADSKASTAIETAEKYTNDALTWGTL